MNTKHSKAPSLQYYGVTRGRLPQRAGLPGLNGGGAAAAVPLNRQTDGQTICRDNNLALWVLGSTTRQ